jgi:hypothetical protein
VREHDAVTIQLWPRPTPGGAPLAILGALATRVRMIRLALVVAVLAALPACGVSGLSFVQDKRVDILAPGDRDEVRLPTTIKWDVKNFAVGAGKGSFGVFVDRAPQRPGKTLAWIFRGNDACRGGNLIALCSSDQFLAQRYVFHTTASSFKVDQVPRLVGSQSGRQLHEVTIVLLDAKGQRIGEGAWSVQLEVKEPKS